MFDLESLKKINGGQMPDIVSNITKASKYSTCCKLYVPQQYNDGTDVSEDFLKATIETITAHFGGATAYNAMGTWFDNGKVYKEPIAVFESYTHVDNDSAIFVCATIMRIIKKQLQQVECAFSVNGVIYFV